MFSKANTYDQIDVLTKGQLRNLADGASIAKRLRDTDNVSEIQEILINTTKDNLRFQNRLDANSLVFKGLSRAAAKAYYG